MKKGKLFLILFTVYLSACKKETISEPVPATPPVVVVPEDQSGTKIDSLRALLQKSIYFKVVSDSIWAGNKGITVTVQPSNTPSIQNVTVDPKTVSMIFPGALLKGNSIPSQVYEPITNYNQAPVSISTGSYMFKNVATKHIPTYASTNLFIKENLNQSESSQYQQLNFIEGQEFTNYGEISLFAGKSWDYASQVALKAGENGHIKKKTGFFTSFDLSIFSLDVDVTQIKDIPVENPVMITTVTYGRSAILSIESNATFQQIKTAYKAAMNNTATEADKKLLNESSITTYINGFAKNHVEQVAATEGYSKVSSFTHMLLAGGKVTSVDYGAAITFKMRNTVTGQSQSLALKYKLDFPL